MITSDFTVGIRKHLYCDDACEVSWFSLPNGAIIEHVRQGRHDRVTVDYPLVASRDEYPDVLANAICAALDPLKNRHQRIDLHPCPRCGAHRWEQPPSLMVKDVVRCGECANEQDVSDVLAVLVGRD